MLSTYCHNSKIPKLMSMAFGQNGLDFALKIEKLLSSQAVYAYILHILPTSSSCGLLRATLLLTKVIMDTKKPNVPFTATINTLISVKIFVVFVDGIIRKMHKQLVLYKGYIKCIQ